MNLSTYQAVVLQSRAQRAIKSSLAAALRAYELTMMQWSIIGLIHEAGEKGVRISDLAQQLDTSLAFVTTTVNMLEAKNLVRRTGHMHDSRAKVVTLDEKFASQVWTVEQAIASEQRQTLYSGLSDSDIETYFKVLRHIASRD
ncbi:MAG TPA: MarR family transcriptional regulator [Candidatus Saccharimonadales bacterium]|nr:MarR family transcriptional regulator [Candidatus Saccharimonadales bacterium]